VSGKLGLARQRGLRPFGFDSHGFRLEPPVPEQEVQAFERRYAISLPREYRAFVTQVSGGGAGPAYGLVAFQETATADAPEVRQRVVAQEFRFLTAYNPREDPALRDFWAREASGELDAKEAARRLAVDIAGTLVLCDEGCGILHLLVVSGAAKGQVWIDSTADDRGYVPLEVGFLDWYERWLDHLLEGGDGVWWLQQVEDARSQSKDRFDYGLGPSD
jgi:hypothetical protein